MRAASNATETILYGPGAVGRNPHPNARAAERGITARPPRTQPSAHAALKPNIHRTTKATLATISTTTDATNIAEQKHDLVEAGTEARPEAFLTRRGPFLDNNQHQRTEPGENQRGKEDAPQSNGEQ
jgi:hypothetical protein